ncbi:hypothetical protein [Chryseobacterium sp.]|uniref:hypothetical protein n=1 Tax=Chryseobacterium sp. TaxID=1871047 RepID=UPI0025C30E1F|nr:hypothetical protein [Chryseobacterium sp.]MBV8325212.1 hypothetical protein [Chryseobacterium sp.]
MPNTPILQYYPKLSNLITLDNIPSSLDFVKSISQGMFSKIYYKNYQSSVSPLGDSAFYSLDIVAKDKIDFDLVYGLKFVLNRDSQNNSISSFPVTVQYNWPILGYVSQFDLDSFSFLPEDIFKVILVSLNLTETKVINEIINVFVNSTGDPIKKFVDDLNAELGGSMTAPIPYPTSDDRIKELTDSINNMYGKGAALAAFTTYIVDNLNISNTKNNLKLFFRNILPQDLDDYILNIIKPRAKITLETSASIEFPRNILKPWIISGGELMPHPDPNSKTSFDFAKAILYADTVEGIGYNLDIAGSLGPSNYSEIGNTGLLLQLDRLKLDLSKTKNIPEADAYGYSPDFTGVYARAVSVTFPPKWFRNENNPPSASSTTLRLGGYDLLIGTGGVSGTFMLESVPVAGQGGSFEYYNDKFSFNYPVILFKKNSTTNEVIEAKANNYQELKTILQGLKATSDAPFSFKFPLSLVPNGQVTPRIFNNAQTYQTYLSGLNSSNTMLWKKLGGQDGFQVGFKSFDITLKQNAVVSSNIEGQLLIPKFTDGNNNPANINVKGHIEANGDFRLAAAAVPPFDPTITLPGVFKLHLKSVELGKENDKFFIGASADIEFIDTLLGGALKGQTLSISALRIYSDGRIDFRVNGGNMTLPKPIKIPIGPTEVSVTAIHFGSHERMKGDVLRKYNYFGFDGGVSIGVAGIDARGDGIKFYYTIDDDEPNGKKHDSYFHIQTVYVDMIIPANSSDPSVSIKGWLSIPEPGEFQEYKGGVSLKVKNPRITGGVDMRLAPKYPAFLIDANIELPNPIALGPVSIYGFRGLLGYRYVAEKEAIGMTSQNTWYQYYTAPKRGVGVDKFSRPDKTEKYNFPFSLGVGALLGDTMANGNIISANAMLLLSLPSMVMVDARMKILSSRVTYQDDPPFFAFFIFGDNSLEFGFGADYKFPEKSGDIIKIYAEIQAGFFFNNPSAWYINFGTKQVPISAKLLKDLFTLKAFLMISGKGIEAGARGEFRFDRTFGPVKIFVLAYLELGGKISFQKPQMGAYFEAGLTIDIDVKIIRIYASVTILLAVESPKPFLIYGAFSVAFKLKILFFKISFSVKVELKWEFNKIVERDPVNPMTQIEGQEKSLVKGVSMLTNETFDLESVSPDNYPNVDTIKKVVPLDTYIDIKTTKGLLPTVESSKVIGGFTNPASNSADLIPPDKIMKGLEMRQVKHQYTLESFEVKAYVNGSWVKYDPFKAMDPTNAYLANAKAGQWQKKDNQYNAIRLLGTTPFSYTEQGNPGWFTPEQYGVLATTLFCHGQEIENSVSDFLNKPLNTLYYASTNSFFQSKKASYQISGDVQYTVGPNGTPIMQGDSGKVSDAANIFGFDKSLEFKNKSHLTIMLPARARKLKLKLSTYSTGLTIQYYSPIIDDTQSFVQYEMEQEYYPRDVFNGELDVSEYFTKKGITKIVIIPDVTDTVQINLILEQMAVLMQQGYQQALAHGGVVGTVQPSDIQLYRKLEGQLNELQSVGCEGLRQEKEEMMCRYYQDIVQHYNLNFFVGFNRRGGTPNGITYAVFISNMVTSRVYHDMLEMLAGIGVQSPLFEVYLHQYARLLEDLTEFVEAQPVSYDGIISRFELVKAKFRQIERLALELNLCTDSTLCNLSAELALKDFGQFNDRQGISRSPLMEAFNAFLSTHPQYSYLTKILSRQINTINTVVMLGQSFYMMNAGAFNTACQDIIDILKDLGNCSSKKKCFTLFHEVQWLSVEDHFYNVNIPSQQAIQEETAAAVNAVTRFVQPIWRPDTAYYIKFVLKDTVDDGITQKPYPYAYAFRTAGPLGFFHLDKNSTYGDIEIKNPDGSIYKLEDTTGEIYDANGNHVKSQTPHPDQYPHTSLRAYIDYQRSYPNADGNIVNAKPLFYNDLTTKISLYFTSTYVSKLLSGWESFVSEGKTFAPLGGTMKVIIKDPVEDTAVNNPPTLDPTEQEIVQSAVDIPQTFETWAVDDNPAIPTILDQYFNMLNNGQTCVGNLTLQKPKSIYRVVQPKKLKPQKLYTAQVLNFYWGTDTVSRESIDENMKRKYAKEVHKFVFQTSRYENFKTQVESCFISYQDANGNNLKKQAVYTIEKSVAADKLTAAWDIINTELGKESQNAISKAIANQYQHPFDRVVQGLFGISPQEDAPTTEFNKIVDPNTGKVLALLIRNPEPFNHPKIPLADMTRKVTLNPDGTVKKVDSPGMVEVITYNSAGVLSENANYNAIYSKDYSQILIMNKDKSITESVMNFLFTYKIWDGTNYIKSSAVEVKNIKIN